MTTRETLFARYKALDALAIDLDTAISEPLYTLRTQAYCDYLMSDPYFDYTDFIRVTFGPAFAQLPLLPATCPRKETGRIASTPAARALSATENETSPLRIVQKGSAAYWNGLASKRAEQHAAAKARVEARKIQSC